MTGVQTCALPILEGKGLKDRTVPLNDICSDYLDEYLEKVRTYLFKQNNSDYKDIVFLSCSGRGMDRFSLLKILASYRKKINLRIPLTGHTFRHTLATELLRAGADIRHIQMILGHESLSTTQKYVHIVQDDLKKVHSKTHPREQVESTKISYKGKSYY